MTTLARRIPWARGGIRQTLGTAVLFSVLPTAVFWVWYLAEGEHGIRPGYHKLIAAMPITSLWITLGPLMMHFGERSLTRLLGALNHTAEGSTWDLAPLQRTIDRADKHYYTVVAPITCAAIAAVCLGAGTIGSIVDISSLGARIGGMIVIAVTGFASATGMWGCYKALALVRAATREKSAPWYGEDEQPNGIRALNTFCWMTALIFSTGSLSLPTLIVVQSQLPSLARGIVIAFMVILGAGGLVLFTVPISWVRRLGSNQRDLVVARYEPALARGRRISRDWHGVTALEVHTVKALYDLAKDSRAEILGRNPVPVPQIITRCAATLILPLALTVLQIAVTNTL